MMSGAVERHNTLLRSGPNRVTRIVLVDSVLVRAQSDVRQDSGDQGLELANSWSRRRTARCDYAVEAINDASAFHKEEAMHRNAQCNEFAGH